MRKTAVIHYFVHHRPGRSPGQRFRCEQYLPALREAGFDIRWHALLNEKDDRIFYGRGRYAAKALLVLRKFFQRLRELRQVQPGDIAFVYREAFMLGNTFFERRLKKRGARLVFDFDDAIWLMEVSEGNRKLSFLKNPGKTAEICRLSDLVITGNDFLAAYARQHARHVAVIPTSIDTEYHRPQAAAGNGDVICIGWTGSESTVKHFETLLPVLRKLKGKYGGRISFKLISNSREFYPEIGLESTAWSLEREVEELAGIDIGIMPLPDDEWSRGKCGFKLLQYMALGLPVLASPVGVNTAIVEEGVNGFLAAGEEEWIEKLSLLIEDAELREKMGARGREKISREYSMQSLKERYVSLFREIS